MNRKQRRIAQSLSKDNAVVHHDGGACTLDEANALAIKEYTLGHVDAALDIFRLMLAKAPGYAVSHNNYGSLLHETGRYAEALKCFDTAIALDKAYADAHNNRGLTLGALERYREAVESCSRAIALKADYATAYNNRGNALLGLSRQAEALADYDKALALDPGYVDAHNNRGNALKAMSRHPEALPSYDRALALNPLLADGYNNRGHTLWELKRYDEALANFEKAAGLNKPILYLPGTALVGRMHLCEWRELASGTQMLAEGIEAGQKICPPFAAAILPLSAALQKKCAEIYAQDKHPPQPALWNGERYAHEKVRLGYFSADFHSHATARLIAGLIELHDRSQFDVIGFSFGPPTGDAMRARLEKAFDRFINVSGMTDLEIAQTARRMEIDIAVDLKGFTQHARPGIFAPRFSPVQVNYLGYPGTMGASYFDYLIADPVLIPESHRQYYTEKIAWLPDSYQVNDASRKISDRVFTRRELGLPESGFVFCCFNNNYKITPEIFAIWMRLLHRVPGSVLWLFADNAAAVPNLRKEAVARGIDAARLVFADRMGQADHLARQKLADLFLDTFPCNAHTTASDALWAGLPMVALMGETFAGRVAASLLTAVGLAELITHSPAEYEALALELATHPEKLLRLRRKLADNKLTSALFDTKLFARRIEEVYRGMLV